MIKNTSLLLFTASLGLFAVKPTLALDARSAAVGGSSIANGYGVQGARENPSSLMRLHRQQQHVHINLGISLDIQDNAGIIDAAIEEDTLVTDIEREIDLISDSAISCDLNSGLDTTCLDNTQNLGELATTVFDILNRADDQPFKATATTDFGVAFSSWSVPIAVHYRISASGSSKTDVANNDLEYVNAFATALSDDRLTLADIIDNVPFSISPDGQTLIVQQLEDVLQSEAEGSLLLREQLGLSMARSFPVAGLNIDIGVSPKFSILTAAGTSASLAEQFNDDTDSLTRQFEDTEITGNTFTIDVGATTQLGNLPLRLSMVGRNLVKESITTNEGFVFETTPQLIVGSAYSIGSLTLTGDLALNEAKVDHLDTQITAIGADYSRKYFGIRAGISHDNARTADATALSLGISLGPVHIGGRITERQSAQAGAQLAFSF